VIISLHPEPDTRPISARYRSGSDTSCLSSVRWTEIPSETSVGFGLYATGSLVLHNFDSPVPDDVVPKLDFWFTEDAFVKLGIELVHS